MTTTSNGWAAWALRALTAGMKSERRPMPRVRLGCEVMEGRFVPATVLYTGTEVWTGPGGGELIVTSTVTEGVSGLTGRRLFEYHVTNDSFQPAYPRDDGVSVFGVPVDDPTGVADITNSMGWISAASDANYVTGGGPGVIWVGSGDPEDTGGYLRPGASADLSFTTPDTAPTSTDATGSAFNDGSSDEASGLCAAPVQGVPSVTFTSGPSKGDNAGEVKFDCRWDNINPSGLKIIVNARNFYDTTILFGSYTIQFNGKSSGTASVVVACTAANTDKVVVVSMTVVDNDNVPLFPGVSAQKEGRTK